MPLIAPTSLPEPKAIQGLPEDQQLLLLDLLFEPSQELHAQWLQSLSRSVYPSYQDLNHAVGTRLYQLAESKTEADQAKLESILASHPRLGEKRVDSAQSAAEQSHLQGDADTLAALNDEYEAKFPGLRYVVFVKSIGGRDAVLANMRARIQRADIDLERREAINVG